MDWYSVIQDGCRIGFILAIFFTGNKLCKDVNYLKSKCKYLEDEVVKLRTGNVDTTKENK